MAQHREQAFIGNGKVFLAERTSNGIQSSLMRLGNCSEVKISIAEDTKTLANYQGGGGNTASSTRIESVTATLSTSNLNNRNLALALYGESENKGQMATETYAVLRNYDDLIRLQGLNAKNVVVKSCAELSVGGLRFYAKESGTAGNTLSIEIIKPATSNESLNITNTAGDIVVNLATNSSAEAITTASDIRAYLENNDAGVYVITGDPQELVTASSQATLSSGVQYSDADFEVTAAGVVVMSEGAIQENSILHITATASAHTLIKSLLNSGKEYVLLVEGLNTADSDAPVVIDISRIKFKPLKELGLISDDFASMELEGELIALENVPKGESAFFTATKLQES